MWDADENKRDADERRVRRVRGRGWIAQRSRATPLAELSQVPVREDVGQGHDLRLAEDEPGVVVEEGRVHGGVTVAGLAGFRVVVGRWPPSGT